jgi:hypothetical protein
VSNPNLFVAAQDALTALSKAESAETSISTTPRSNSIGSSNSGSSTINPDETLNALIKAERFEEAVDCTTYVQARKAISKLQQEYEKAKQEDLLHEAIAIREKLTQHKQSIQHITEATIKGWTESPDKDHFTLKQMHELIIDKVGVKAVSIFLLTI